MLMCALGVASLALVVECHLCELAHNDTKYCDTFSMLFWRVLGTLTLISVTQLYLVFARNLASSGISGAADGSQSLPADLSKLDALPSL